MRTLVHLSDLHFGQLDRAILKPLREAVAEIQPHLIVISGDLTQRARADEFEQARDFLRTLPGPHIVVPGNHDVPLHNLYARFCLPLREYRRYISDDLEPFFADDEIAVLGINTARSLVWKSGRVNFRQMARIEERFCELGGRVTTVGTHHPFELREHYSGRDSAGLAHRAVVNIARRGLCLLM